MANWDVCFSWMLDNEDATRAYKVVPDAPPGAHAIAGVNSGAWPAEYAAIAALPQDQRGPLVEAFYQERFWNKWYTQLTSDEVAKRVLDASVNMGSVAAVRCLQEACNEEGGFDPPLAEDGKWGQHTIAAVNSSGAWLISAFRQARVARYKAIVAANPALAHYLPQWIARAEK
jgi:lysozyme family protein